MARLRSPNYPSISLPEAISKVKLIYEREYTNQASREVMIKAMGYSGINGASAVVFSALSKYGLIISTGNDQYKISEDGLNLILFQKGEAPRAQAIERAAFSPQLFADLHEQYPATPPSDENLTAYLVKKSFNPRWVSDIIRSYRDTIELVSIETSSILPLSTKIKDADGDASLKTPTENKASFLEDESEGSVLSFKISRDSDVRIRFSGNVTQEAIEKLVSLLNLSKDVYPTVKELTEETERDSE